MLMRIPAMLCISTDDLHDKLQKFVTDVSFQANGAKWFAGGLSAFVSFGTAFATADFHDALLPAVAWSYLFFGAACIALCVTYIGARRIFRTKEIGVEDVFSEICRSKQGFPDGTMGAEPLSGAGPEATNSDKRTAWADYGVVQQNMRVYG